MDYTEILQSLKNKLSQELYEHSLAVADKSSDLALHWQAEKQRAQLAGLLHDYAKNTPKHLLLEYTFVLDDIEKQEEKLWHGPIGAQLVQRDFLIEDSEVLDAIRWHSTGAPGMPTVAKIVYVADYCDSLKEYKNTDKILKISYTNLDLAVMYVIQSKLKYLLNNTPAKIIHPRSIHLYNELIKKDNTLLKGGNLFSQKRFPPFNPPFKKLN